MSPKLEKHQTDAGISSGDGRYFEFSRGLYTLFLILPCTYMLFNLFIVTFPLVCLVSLGHMKFNDDESLHQPEEAFILLALLLANFY